MGFCQRQYTGVAPGGVQEDSMTVDAVSFDRDVDDVMEVVPLESASKVVSSTHEAASVAIGEVEQPGRFDRMDVDVGMPVGRVDAAIDAAKSAGIVRDRNKKTPMERMTKLVAGLSDGQAETVVGALEGARDRVEAMDPESVDGVDMMQEAVKTDNFPNIALEVVRLALRVENYQTTHKLNALQKEGHELKGKIELLLNLKGELQAISKKDAASYELSDKAKDLLRQLREKEIDVFPGAGNSVTKVEMTEAKGRIESQISHHRTELQVLFSTKISVTVQFLNSMIDVVKNILKNTERANSKMIEGQRTR